MAGRSSPGCLTVQGLLSDTIHRIVGERLLPQGSGRTDAGVHALGQVCLLCDRGADSSGQSPPAR